MKKTIFLVAIVIAASISIFGQTTITQSDKMSKTEQEVTNLVTEYGNALVKRDTAAIERLLADDFMNITGKGEMRSKSEVVANNKSLFRRRMQRWRGLRRATRKCVSMAIRR